MSKNLEAMKHHIMMIAGQAVNWTPYGKIILEFLAHDRDRLDKIEQRIKDLEENRYDVHENQ
jgi:hypothetical protein